MKSLWYVIESEEWYDEPPMPQISHWNGCMGVLQWRADENLKVQGGTIHSEHQSEVTALMELWANQPL